MDDQITLRGGLTVSLATLKVGWALERRGLRMRVDRTGTLVIGPKSLLSYEDQARIRLVRDELTQAVAYQAPPEFM
jgi:hypothetical protein